MTKPYQRQLEFDQFVKFAKLIQLDLLTDSVRQPESPQPDILHFDGSNIVGYELTFATDKDVEQVVRQDSSAAVWFDADVPGAVKKKLGKQYECSGPIELIVVEGAAPLMPKVIWVDDVTRALRSARSLVFRRVWVVKHDFSSIIAQWDFDAVRRVWTVR